MLGISFISFSGFKQEKLQTTLARNPRRICGITPVAAVSSRPFVPSGSSRSLYNILGIPQTPDPKLLSITEIRTAYLRRAKQFHPDVVNRDLVDVVDYVETGGEFQEIARAWSILGDEQLRKVYDTTGEAGVQALQSISQRAEEVRERLSHLPGDQLDYLGETGQLVGGLLTPTGAEDFYARISESKETGDVENSETRPPEQEDACPRSIEEAIWNIQNHPDHSVRYYGLWWVYKFKVTEAEPALVNVLQTADYRTPGGGFSLRRRAALALGVVASPPTTEDLGTVEALGDALRSTDFFLRYRAAEALANIAYRSQDSTSLVDVVFPTAVVEGLAAILSQGKADQEREDNNRSGVYFQESLFDLEKLQPEVRERLETIFDKRRANEQRSRRTTMTPQLGVDEVGKDNDQPFEWTLKAISAILTVQDDRKTAEAYYELIDYFTTHPVPLVRYAAHKAMYALTKRPQHTNKIVDALRYGSEHHYTQRVLIRDLGDLGFSQGAGAVASCPMVENSFKILALKNMMAKEEHNAQRPAVRSILEHMDSLL